MKRILWCLILCGCGKTMPTGPVAKLSAECHPVIVRQDTIQLLNGAKAVVTITSYQKCP